LATIDRDTLDAIGDVLRMAYRLTAEEPLPPEIMDLVHELERVVARMTVAEASNAKQ